MNRITGARDAPLDHLEVHELPADAMRFLLAERRRPVEVVLLPSHHPTEIGLEYGCGFVNVVAMQPHGGFEPQRVARAQTARDHAGGLTGAQDRLPDPIG